MEKIKKLRKYFKKYKIDGYIVPKNDEFFSEYTPKSKDYLNIISNFSGSYGFALILKKKNYLFVDGRYTLQATNQSGKNFKILNLPLKNVKSIIKNKNIGFDPKLFNKNKYLIFIKKTKSNFIPIDPNLIKLIYKNKEKNKKNNFFILKNSVTGETSKKKINKLTNFIKKNKIDFQFVTAPENVAWLLNIRGEYSKFSPIPNSHLIIDSKKNLYLFCNLKSISKKLKNNLKNVKFFDIENISTFILSLKEKIFAVDNHSCSIYFLKLIQKNNIIKKINDPIYFYKSIKNKTEIINTKKIHEIDGAALTKFIFWLKNNYRRKKITEIDAQEKLLKFRKNFSRFQSLSFPTISSSGPNGAIVHYNAEKKTNRILKKGDIYLVDSGGQYKFGTTDVTRTISLKNNNMRIKNIFTRVLKGHISVANFKFKKNTTGSEIDAVARSSLKEKNLDFSHGTGHGVGYYLNVHEGPQSLSKFNKVKLLPGMILSNEPGYYEKGKFGIRIENLVVIKKKLGKSKFENLTYVPIDKNLILKNIMNKTEIEWLNKYHDNVYKKLKKYMNKDEKFKLREYCSNI